MDRDSLIVFKLLLYVGIAVAIWFFFFRETEEHKERRRLEEQRRTEDLERRVKERTEEQERLAKEQAEEQKRLAKKRAEQEERERQRREAERLERERKKADAEKEFDKLVSKGMPRSVARAHREYMDDNPLARGQKWYGEDVSPLTFYGYRVGKTRGLRQSERQEIIRYVMRARLTDPLARTYQVNWGRPLTRQRRNAIISHIDKLAAQRGSRRNYEVAVAEWIDDSDWAGSAMDAEIKEFGQYGFK